MNPRTKHFLFPFVLALFLQVQKGHSTELFSTYSADSPSFDGSPSFAIAGEESQLVQLLTSRGYDYRSITFGAQFSIASDSSLEGISLALNWAKGTNQVKVELRSGQGDKPDTPISSWILSDLMGFDSNTKVLGSVESILDISGINLTGGSKYWLVTSAVASDTWAGWNMARGNTPRDANNWISWGYNYGGGTTFGDDWIIQSTPPANPQQATWTPAFAIYGTSVPSPDTGALMLTGIMLIFLRGSISQLCAIGRKFVAASGVPSI